MIIFIFLWDSNETLLVVKYRKSCIKSSLFHLFSNYIVMNLGKKPCYIITFYVKVDDLKENSNRNTKENKKYVLLVCFIWNYYEANEIYTTIYIHQQLRTYPGDTRGWNNLAMMLFQGQRHYVNIVPTSCFWWVY